MRKILVVFALSFFTFQLSAQLEKGNFYFGSSQLKKDLTEDKLLRGVYFETDLGYLIKENNVIGVSFSDFTYSLFYKRYFLPAKIKPFAGFTLGKQIGGFSYSDVNVGGAFFLNNLVSLELLFELPIHRNKGFSNFDFFPRSRFLNPNLSLRTRWYLSSRKSNKELPIALNNIRKGIWIADVEGKLERKQVRPDARALFYSLNAKGQYFFNEQSFAIIGVELETFSRQYVYASIVHPPLGNTLEARFGIGRYFSFNDVLLIKTGVTSSIKNFIHNTLPLNTENNTRITKNEFKNTANVAMAVFKGRHKLELGLDVEYSAYSGVTDPPNPIFTDPSIRSH